MPNREHLRILAVGDMCPGDKYIAGVGVLSQTKKRSVDFPFEKIRHFLTQGDLVIGNLEGLLTAATAAHAHRSPAFCGLPGFADAMVRAGVHVVNVANNHTMEYGSPVLAETIEHLRKAGLRVCGLRDASGGYHSDPVIMDVKGWRVAVLGYNWVDVHRLPAAGSLIAQSHDSIVNYTWERASKSDISVDASNKAVRADIGRVRDRVDLVIVVAHWAYEFVTVPPLGVTREAHALIEAGADIVLGGHPHVLQGTEEHQAGIICYSLGNFVFDRRNWLSRQTAIADLSIDETKRIRCTLRPCVINRRFQPELATPRSAGYIMRLIVASNALLASPNKEALLDDDVIYEKYERCYRRYKAMAILAHFWGVFRHPSLMVVIASKARSLLHVLRERLKGRKVRW